MKKLEIKLFSDKLFGEWKEPIEALIDFFNLVEKEVSSGELSRGSYEILEKNIEEAQKLRHFLIGKEVDKNSAEYRFIEGILDLSKEYKEKYLKTLERR